VIMSQLQRFTVLTELADQLREAGIRGAGDSLSLIAA